MSNSNSSINLASNFPPPEFSEWQAKLEKDLKGKDPARLNWQTGEGFSMQPMYARADLEQLKKTAQLATQPGEFPFVRGANTAGNSFEIRQPVHARSIKEANAIALDVLKRGADSIEFLSQVDCTPAGFRLLGIALEHANDMEALLEGIYPDAAPLHIRCGLAAPLHLDYLSNLIKKLNLSPTAIKGSLNFDIFASLISGGALPAEFSELYGTAAGLINDSKEKLPGMRVLAVDAYLAAERGAGLVQELAYGLAAGSDLLAGVKSAGATIADVAARLHFNLSIGSSYFMEMARLRAARLLWAKILAVYDKEAAMQYPMYIGARTALANKTRYDAHNNMLRVTTESMAAILGGCDSLVVHGFHATCSGTVYDEFGDRMARNTALIVRHESYLDKVVDPAAGSYYIEILTKELISQTWQAFLEIEAGGGLALILPKGDLQKEWALNAAGAMADVAARKKSVIGTNQYPNAEENLAAINDARKAEPLQFRSINIDLGWSGKGPVANVLPASRLAVAYEELRIQTENYFALNARLPHVFLYTFGNMTMRRARAGFAANFFGCAGYQITDNVGFDPVDSGLATATGADANILVLCSSDEEYARYGPEIINKLKQALPECQIVVAGNPACLIELQQAGAQGAIHIKTNVLESLQAFHKDLGVG